jgi:hypothetical protein
MRGEAGARTKGVRQFTRVAKALASRLASLGGMLTPVKNT